jgi:hypothetical protein
MGRSYQPGERVKGSGIYRVVHGKGAHYHEHEVTIISGNTFPPCNICGSEVRFHRQTLARLVDKHSNFSPASKSNSAEEKAEMSYFLETD